jgi:hypothetical protein
VPLGCALRRCVAALTDGRSSGRIHAGGDGRRTAGECAAPVGVATGRRALAISGRVSSRALPVLGAAKGAGWYRPPECVTLGRDPGLHQTSVRRHLANVHEQGRHHEIELVGGPHPGLREGVPGQWPRVVESVPPESEQQPSSSQPCHHFCYADLHVLACAGIALQNPLLSLVHNALRDTRRRSARARWSRSSGDRDTRLRRKGVDFGSWRRVPGNHRPK